MSEQKLTITLDRESHLYSIGEKALFRFENVAKPATLVFSCDGGATLDTRRIEHDTQIAFSLETPGVLRCSAEQEGETPVVAGAAFSPEQIRPALPEPEDFDAFWAKWDKKLESVPEDFQMTKRSTEGEFDFYELSCAGLNGTRARGFLRIPHAAEPLPLLVYVEGAGRGQNFVTFHQHCQTVDTYLKMPLIVSTINVHSYKPADTDAEHLKQHAEFEKQLGCQYWFENWEDPDWSRTFFVRAITGITRLCNCISALPQVDRKNIVYLGTSQGGAFGLYLGARCPQIKAIFAGVPALGDCGGPDQGRHNTCCNNALFRTHVEKMRYFDTVNFARRIHVPILVSAGLIDSTCTPTSVYAIYNVIPARKYFYCKPEHAHCDGTEDYTPTFWNFPGYFITKK